MSGKAETTRLLAVRKLVEERIEKLTEEKGMLQHALERVTTILKFEEAMKNEG